MEFSPKLIGIGPAKTGTHTVAGIFSQSVASAHEYESDILITLILQKTEGILADGEIQNYLRCRRQYIVDSSQLNFFIIKELLEIHPQSKYLLTVREPVSWLRSYINDSLRRNTTQLWQKFREHRFKPDLYPWGAEDEILKARGLYSLTAYLKYWDHHYSTVLKEIPKDRLYIVKTDDLSSKISQIASFAGVSENQIFVTRHLFKNTQDFGVVEQINEQYLHTKIEQLCPSIYELNNLID